MRRLASAGADLDAGFLAVKRTVLLIGKDVTEGTPYRPDYVTRRFKALATAAGLPVIKLHEGRHSAAHKAAAEVVAKLVEAAAS